MYFLRRISIGAQPGIEATSFESKVEVPPIRLKGVRIIKFFLYSQVILVIGFLGCVKVHSAPRVPRLSVAELYPSNYFYNNIEGMIILRVLQA